MLLKKIVFILFFIGGSKAFALSLPDTLEKEIVSIGGEEAAVVQDIESFQRPSPLFEKIKLRKSKNKKVTAALLAFPFPCGIVGLHRIYLGSAPYVPIVYIATIGGGFGILPFIDFCILLIDKEIEPYINNEKVFMWVR